MSTGGSSCSLRAAIMEANALSGADTVVLNGETYTLSIPGIGEDGAATGDLDITESVTIQSAPGLLSIIDAAGFERVLDIHAAASPVLLSGLVIRGGATTDVGGGLRIGTSGQVTIQLSSIEGNLANEGGGISTRANNTLLQFSIVTANNVAPVVGAARAVGSGITLQDGGTLRLEGVAVYGNVGITPSTVPAMAIYAERGDAVQIFSSTISDNTGPDGAPASELVTTDTDVLLQNVTIANGVFGLRVFGIGNSIFMRNTIIANNAIDCDIGQASLVRDIDGYNLSSDNSCLLVNNFGNLPGTGAKRPFSNGHPVAPKPGAAGRRPVRLTRSQGVAASRPQRQDRARPEGEDGPQMEGSQGRLARFPLRSAPNGHDNPRQSPRVTHSISLDSAENGVNVSYARQQRCSD